MIYAGKRKMVMEKTAEITLALVKEEAFEFYEWLKRHEQDVKAVFPDTWTPLNDLNPLRVFQGLEKVGIDLENVEEFAHLLTVFTMLGIILKDNDTRIKANPQTIFPLH